MTGRQKKGQDESGEMGEVTVGWAIARAQSTFKKPICHERSPSLYFIIAV
jgi:hypothetical protein